MGNDLSERKLEVSKGTPRVVDSGVKIEDVYAKSELVKKLDRDVQHMNQIF